MSQEFEDLKSQAKANEDAEAAAATLLGTLASRLLSNPSPAEVKALGTELKASADSLAAAIVANTPAENPA